MVKRWKGNFDRELVIITCVIGDDDGDKGMGVMTMIGMIGMGW